MKIIKIILLFVLGLLLISCNDGLKVQGFNNANRGKVAYVSKNGHNSLAQLGNPDRPFAHPWAAVAAIPDSGWLVQFLDAGTYTFGSVGSGADFTHDSTTVDGTFNFVKHGCEVDFNGSTVKYLRHPTVKKLLRGMLKLDSNSVTSFRNLKLDLSEVDTVVNTLGRRGALVNDFEGKSITKMHFVETRFPIMTNSNYTYYGFFDNATPDNSDSCEVSVTIEKALGGSMNFRLGGVRKFDLNVRESECVWNMVETEGVSVKTLLNVNIGSVENHLQFDLYNTYAFLDLGVWEFNSTRVSEKLGGWKNVPFSMLLSSYPSDSCFAHVNLNTGFIKCDSISSGSGGIFAFTTQGSGVGVFTLSNVRVSGSTLKPVVISDGNNVLLGNIIGGNSMRGVGGKLDISGCKFITADTTSTRATSATTILCNGFRSNKAMSATNTTKVGTEFINASAF